MNERQPNQPENGGFANAEAMRALRQQEAISDIVTGLQHESANKEQARLAESDRQSELLRNNPNAVGEVPEHLKAQTEAAPQSAGQLIEGIPEHLRNQQ